MPHTQHITPGDYIAAELIAQKAQGRSFNRTSLGPYIDVLLEKWNQTAPTAAAPDTPKADLTPAEAIYAAYPRKVGKMAALKAITTAISSRATDGMEKLSKSEAALILLEKTRAFAAAVATWPARDRPFIPHPATWFNRGSYLDDPKEWQRGHSATTNTTARDYTKV